MSYGRPIGCCISKMAKMSHHEIIMKKTSNLFLNVKNYKNLVTKGLSMHVEEGIEANFISPYGNNLGINFSILQSVNAFYISKPDIAYNSIDNEFLI